MTITHVAAATAATFPTPQRESITMLLEEADALTGRPGLPKLLALIRSAHEHDALTPELAHRLGMQLRLLAGPAPLTDDDIDDHMVLQTLLFELSEIAAEVDGVHVDDLGPRIEALLGAGDDASARRLITLADAAHRRLRTLNVTLTSDLLAR